MNKKGKVFNYELHQLNWLEWVAIFLSAWFFIYPKPSYEFLLIVLLILPFLGMFLNGIHKPSIASLVEIDRGTKTRYDVADFIDIPAFAILLRCFIDYEIDNYKTLIIVVILTFIGSLIFLFYTHSIISKSNKDRFWIYSSVLFCIFIYSYSAVIAVNCTFDYSKPQVFETKVIDKYISRGKNTSYYIKVKPWGHHYDIESIRIPSIDYTKYSINQPVKIDYKEGLLGISWYYLE